MTDIPAMLEGYRETAPGKGMARCPSHDDRTPSLSVTQTPDGVWLLHCFAGCTSLEVAQSLGLEYRDLFPDRRIRRIEPRERPRLSAADARAALDDEAKVVWIVGTAMIENRDIDEDDWQRLTTAVRRIGAARALCCSARFRP